MKKRRRKKALQSLGACQLKERMRDDELERHSDAREESGVLGSRMRAAQFCLKRDASDMQLVLSSF